jgi:restriction system protein
MPTWEGFLTPVLRALSDGDTLAIRALQDRVADTVGLSEEEREELIDSGQARFRNRIGWAASSLARAGAVERPRRGTYVITRLGHELLGRHPDGMSEAQLLVIPAYRDYVPATRSSSPSVVVASQNDVLDPRERISAGIEQIHGDVAGELLARIRDAEPTFLEQTVVDLLVAMGYGGADEKRVRRVGGTGDGGVDGVIDQDPLGLGRIYIQAKRYAPDNTVGRPAIQGFVGALHGQQADQGVFITTSSFTNDASEYARQVNAAVVLIDGRRLSELLIQYGVGVQVEKTYTVVKLDDDYFEK